MQDYETILPIVRRPVSHTEEAISLVDVVRARCYAWRFRHAATAQLTILESRRRVTEARRVIEETEAETHLRREWRTLPREQVGEILERETGIERMMLERERCRQQRLGLAPGEAGCGTAALPAAIEWDVSDEQIEGLAIKAVTRLSRLKPTEAERAWAAWRQELGMRFPPHVAAEAARRAEELRRLAE